MGKQAVDVAGCRLTKGEHLKRQKRHPHRVAVRLSDDERAQFAAFCAAQNLTPSEALRRFVRSAALYGPTFEGEARDAIRAWTVQIRSIGVNLNQVVRAMNTGLVPDSAKLREWLKDLYSILVDQGEFYDSLCARDRQRAVRATQEAAPDA